MAEQRTTDDGPRADPKDPGFGLSFAEMGRLGFSPTAEDPQVWRNVDGVEFHCHEAQKWDYWPSSPAAVVRQAGVRRYYQGIEVGKRIAADYFRKALGVEPPKLPLDLAQDGPEDSAQEQEVRS